jgi:hypothetical protein
MDDKFGNWATWQPPDRNGFAYFDVVVTETEKAFCLKIDHEMVWFPKSRSTLHMDYNGEGKNVIQSEAWLFQEKNVRYQCPEDFIGYGYEYH